MIPLKYEGSYYLIVNVEYYREKINKKDYENEEQLDKLFCRMVFEI
jgi:hypothetical protein